MHVNNKIRKSTLMNALETNKPGWRTGIAGNGPNLFPRNGMHAF